MIEAQLRELIPFLRDRNSQVRQVALSNLLGHTPKGSPHRNIFFSANKAGGLNKPKENEIIRDLKVLCRDQPATAHDAFRALVNLSDSPLLVSSLAEPAFLIFIVSYIINPDSILADLASMLLSNLTATSTACSALLSLKVPVILDPKSSNPVFPVQSRCETCIAPVPYPSGTETEVLALPLLIDAFVEGAAVDPEADLSTRKRKGEAHFLSSVFANLTVAPTGRIFFLTPQPASILQPDADFEYPLSKLVPFTEHKDTIRRGGATSTIKNCAFLSAGHQALLTPDTVTIAIPPSTIEAPGMDILPSILLPLAGPEEFDLDDQEKLPSALQFLPPTKTREPDPVLRLTHVETLLLLCTTRWGRENLRENGVYEIVRAAHEVESVDKISEHIERLVNLLKSDEALETAADDGTLQIEPVEEDDEDMRIEEV
ncbi:DUF383-domain-containing protein [Athelia psychrophila]|uniref:DUF383-domain-containing protein n=1 Tax=Athelia psychrophila TaxID=1759441 RepID=A0A166TD65_9AGAM|nr:DUF383-domain-containing protein [Fibularhizoctonia sp. CBS 109695]